MICFAQYVVIYNTKRTTIESLINKELHVLINIIMITIVGISYILIRCSRLNAKIKLCLVLSRSVSYHGHVNFLRIQGMPLIIRNLI